MKLYKSTIVILTTELMLIGLLFGLFTKLTGISIFYPALAGIILYSLAENAKIFLNRSVLFPLILFIVLILYDFGDHLNNLPKSVLFPFGIFSMVWPYFLTAIVLENIISLKRSEKVIVTIGKFAFILIILIMLISVINEFVFPGITRNISKKYWIMYMQLPQWAWALNFGTIYGLPIILIPVIVFYKGKRVYFFMIIGLFFLTIITAGFLTALLITMISAMLGLLLRLNPKSIKFAIIGLILFMGVFLSSVNFIIANLPNLPNAIYQEKSQDLAELQNSNSVAGAIENSRSGVYQRSLEAIQHAPVIGTGTFTDTGQHSYWLDRLGFLGIIGTAFYFLVLFTLYKRSMVLIHDNDRYVYRCIGIFVFLLLFVNPFEWKDFWIITFVLVPCMINYLKTTSPKKAL